MKIKAIFILSAIIVAGMILAVQALSGETNRAELEAIVDDYIGNCEAKSAMLDSRSEKIRRDAMLACLRATFCRALRAELIDELVSSNVEPKSHKVYHFLNARFNEVVGAKKLASR
jgi:hypothetical protein